MEQEDTVVYDLSDLRMPTKEEIRATIRPRDEVVRPVVEYSLDGRMLNTYDSINDASRRLGIPPNTIRNCCIGRSGHTKCLVTKKYQRIFLFRGDDIQERLKLLAEREDRKWKKGLPRQVDEYNLKGRFLATYSSRKEAARYNNTTSYAIGRCCSGNVLYIGNRIFLHHGDDIRERLPLVKERLFLESQKRKKCRPVDEYTLDGKFVRGYVSGSEASRVTGVDVSNILRCCYNKKLTTRGRIFLLAGDGISDRLDYIESKQKNK